MIFDKRSGPILEEFKAAQDEANAILDSLNGASQDSFQDLMRKYNDAHGKAMGIWKRLESFRIDK